MDEITRTLNGAATGAQVVAATASGSNAVGRPSIEPELEALWMELLGMTHVGRDETFLMLGGESLLAVQVASRVQERYGVEVPLRAIFVGTVNSLAAEIRSRLQAAGRS